MAGFNANVFYSNKIKLIYSEYFWDDEFIRSIDSSVYLFQQFTWNCESIIDSFPWDFEEKFNSLNPNFNIKSNLTFCSPNSVVHEKIKSSGYSSILLNHNALVDYDKFHLSSEKLYRAVLIARPFWWKRVFLADQVSGLAYVKGSDWANDATSWGAWRDMKFSFLAEDVRQPVVADLISKSACGLILSGNTGEHLQGLNEGANYSTIEYLFSGIPVISTPNQGGRNFWLNASNSITVDPYPMNVAKAVSDVCENSALEIVSSAEIRRAAISSANSLRENFIEKIGEIFSINNIDADARNIFADAYFHKFLRYDVAPIDIIEKIR